MDKDLLCYTWVKNSPLFDDDVKGFLFYEIDGLFHASTLYRCVSDKSASSDAFSLNDVLNNVCPKCDADLAFKLEDFDDVLIEELMLFEKFLKPAEIFNSFTGSLEETYLKINELFSEYSYFNVSLIDFLEDFDDEVLKKYTHYVKSVMETFNKKIFALRYDAEFKSITRKDVSGKVLKQFLPQMLDSLVGFYEEKPDLAIKLLPTGVNITGRENAFKVFEDYLSNDFENDTRRVFYVSSNTSWLKPLNEGLISVNMVSCSEYRVISDLSIQEFFFILRQIYNFSSLAENTFSVQEKSLTEREGEVVSVLIPSIENVDSVLPLDTVIESASII